jgi:hypothetical protein
VSGISPNARSLAQLRAEGWTAQVVEQTIPHTFIKRDLFHCIDIVAVKAGEGVLGIQATTGPNAAARVQKIQESIQAQVWLQSPARLEVWAWSKRGMRGERKMWEVRRIKL